MATEPRLTTPAASSAFNIPTAEFSMLFMLASGKRETVQPR
jgi:hypothetical protein